MTLVKIFKKVTTRIVAIGSPRNAVDDLKDLVVFYTKKLYQRLRKRIINEL